MLTLHFSEKVCCSSFLFRLVDESILRFVRALIRSGEVQPAAALEAPATPGGPGGAPGGPAGVAQPAVQLALLKLTFDKKTSYAVKCRSLSVLFELATAEDVEAAYKQPVTDLEVIWLHWSARFQGKH